MRDDRALGSYAGIAPALSLSPTVTRAPTNCHCHVHTVVAERFTAFRQRSRSPRLNNQTRRTGLPQCAASGLISGRRAGRTESERGGLNVRNGSDRTATTTTFTPPSGSARGRAERWRYVQASASSVPAIMPRVAIRTRKWTRRLLELVVGHAALPPGECEKASGATITRLSWRRR
jgi:hypothetical protein